MRAQHSAAGYRARFHGSTVLALLLSATATAGAQSIGQGSSPGRAAYRPEVSWNNGPYYTAPHVNPYGPRPAVANDLIESTPTLPPYANGPHGLYGAFTPGLGSLTPYAEGFSPYSGYAGWYQQTYGVVPTRENVVRARVLFFNSAPRPPEGVLPPLPPATPTTATPASVPRTPQVKAGTPVPPAAATVPIYRSSVAGAR